MCGICGFANIDQTIVKYNILKRMNAELSHRGPDGEGHFIGDFISGRKTISEGDIGLAHKRLSIIDLSENARQPMTDSDENLAVVFNGEIYNHIELRTNLEKHGHLYKSQSDTETLLYAYKEWGNKFINKLEGMFAFALWDKQKKLLIVARDRLGIKPLYYFLKGSKFAFASELKSLLHFPYVEKKINYSALCDYFETRYILGPDSIFQYIYKLEPGHLLTVSTSGFNKEKYWALKQNPEIKYKKNEIEVVDNLDRLLNNVINQHLISDVPIGSFLSGGIDSSLVSAIAHRHYNGKLKTFTIGFDDKNFDEAPYASKIASFLGTEHYEHYITENDLLSVIDSIYRYYDEPFGDASAIPMIVLSRLSSNVFKTALSGDGGDELFHGYSWYSQIERSRKLFKIPYLARNFFFNKYLTNIRRLNSLSGLREKKFSRLFSQKLAIYQDWKRNELLGKKNGNYIKILDAIINDKTHSIEDLYFKLGRLGLSTWLPDDFLVKVDRASMGMGLEVRVPLLDHRVVEYTTSLSPLLNINKNSNKYLLKQILEKYIPRVLFERKKQGFSIPLAKWMSTSLRPLVQNLLSTENIKHYGILNEEFVNEQVSTFLKKPELEATRLWLLINFQLWCNEYYK